MEPPLPERIRERLKILGKSASAASTESGLGRTVIRDILSGKAKSPQLATLVRLALPLDCTLAYLTGESDDPHAGPALEIEYQPRYEVLADYLEAGVFRQSLWQKKDENGPELEADLLYNDLRLIGWDFSLFKMADDSMSDLNIVRGDLITGAHGEGNSKDIDLVHGLIVVVRLLADDIQAAETSLRQVEIEGDVIRLVTRGKRDHGAPIVVGERYKKAAKGVNVYKALPHGAVWVQALAVRVTRELGVNLGENSLALS